MKQMETGKITAVCDNGSSTDILVRVENAGMAAVIKDKEITAVALQLVDGRMISHEQRRKIYATLRDISEYTGYTPQETKEIIEICAHCKDGKRLFFSCRLFYERSKRIYQYAYKFLP